MLLIILTLGVAAVDTEDTLEYEREKVNVEEFDLLVGTTAGGAKPPCNLLDAIGGPIILVRLDRGGAIRLVVAVAICSLS